MRQRIFLHLLFAMWFFILSCTKETSVVASFTEAVPVDASFIIQTDNYPLLLKKLNRSTITKPFINSSFSDKIDHAAAFGSLFSKSKKLAVAGIENGKNNFDFLVVTFQSAIDTVALKKFTSKTTYYNKIAIRQLSKGKSIFFVCYHKGLFLGSASGILVENAIRQLSATQNLKNTIGFSKAYASLDTHEDVNIIVNFSRAASLQRIFFPRIAHSLSRFSNWLALDVSIDKNSILFNGVSIANDSAAFVCNIFKNTTPQNNRLSVLTPQNSLGFASYSFDDPEQFRKNLYTYRTRAGYSSSKKNKAFTQKDFFALNGDEFGSVFLNKGTVFAIAVKNNQKAFDAIKKLAKSNIFNYRGYKLFENSYPKLVSDMYAPFGKNISANYIAFIEDFVLLAEEASSLKDCINAYLSQSTLDHKTYWQKTIGELNENSSMLFIANIPAFVDMLAESVLSKNKKDIRKIKTLIPLIRNLVVQFIANKEKIYATALIRNSEKSEWGKQPRELFSSRLGAALLSPAFVVKNHYNGAKEFFVQDNMFNIYRIDNRGRILWKKNIGEPIIGDVHEVDLYRNRKLQLAFATSSKFCILDRNGNNVGAFPITVNGKISCSAVFDYDRNRNYRFVVNAGNKTFVYDRNGKLVPGFKFTTTASKIRTEAKHFRIASKDYLIFVEENGKVHILNRRGKPRLKLKEKLVLSKNPVYWHKGELVSSDTEGNLIFISLKGAVRKKKWLPGKDVLLTIGSNVVTGLSGNTLYINDSKVELSPGMYTKPQIFTRGNKTYIATTNIPAEEVYIFDKQGNLLQGFPLWGNTPGVISTLKNNSLIFVTGTDKNSLTVYAIP